VKGPRSQPPLVILGRRVARVPGSSRFHPLIERQLRADMRRFHISRSFAIAWHLAHSMGALELTADRGSE